MNKAGAAGVRKETAGTKAAKKPAQARFNQTMLRIMGGALVVCLFVYITRMAMIASGAKKIDELNDTIRSLEENRQYLSISLDARQNTQRVYDEAVNRLHMTYPDESRVYVVSLPGMTASDVQTAFETQDTATP